VPMPTFTSVCVRVLVLFAALCPAIALAQPHRDVQLYVEQGVIRTGAIDFDTPGNPVIPNLRVYPGFLGEFANGTNDPGFNASTGTFAQGTLIGFDIMDAARKWDGVDFDAIPAERLAVSLGNQSRLTPLLAGEMVAGFNFTQASSSGTLHQHINYFVTAPASTGIYLLTVRVRASAGASPSEPIYIVFNQGNRPASEHQAAIDYVNNVILAPAFCSGDASGDGVVNFTDITTVLANFGVQNPPAGSGDADNSGVVNFTDITTVLSNFGVQCS
jgi:hypothetical protein